MKTSIALVQASALVAALQGWTTHAANAGVLLDAPSAGGNYYGMYCDSCIGAQFTLAGSYNISTIDVVLRTPASTSFTTFDFSLLSSVAPITTISSEALTAPLGVVSIEVMNVNETLQAGTYYLVGNVPGYVGTPVTPGDVDGWLLSTGVYNNAAGTIANGVGGFQNNTWVLTTGPGFPAPAFSVNGSLAAPVPEPASLAILGAALVGFGLLRRRRTA